MILSAITVWQPWASLIAIGAKPWEFRDYAAPASKVGTRIAIHAGARPARLDEMMGLLWALGGRARKATGLLLGPEMIDLLEGAANGELTLPYSSIVCTAVLGKPIRDEELAKQMGFEQIADSYRHEHSNYGWPLTDVVPLQPVVPARGKQGLWPVTLPDDA
jgi:hypothetical protein